MKNYLILGQWNAICDRCGQKFKAKDLQKDWQGLMVCEKDFELRNQQDFIRVYPERVGTPWARPESEDDFITLTCDLWSSQGRADFGVADCAQADLATPIESLIEIFSPSSIAGIAIASRSISGVVTYY